VGFRSNLKTVLNKLFSKVGFELVPRVYVYDWQKDSRRYDPSETIIQEGARQHLIPENPGLISLQERYKNSEYPEKEEALWTDDRIKAEDILYFRGHNAFLYQDGRFNRNIIGYLLSYFYIKSIDDRSLLDHLVEDDSFGAIAYDIDGNIVTRDLLDSILEIYFLDRHLNLFQKPEFNVLDIGAGYGRLAYRMAQAFSNLGTYLCADAIAVSSFIADYYLGFRGISDKARIVPLDTIRENLKKHSLDLAVNVHSFSECSITAIDWWMGLVAENRIPYLFIVPNSKDDLLTLNRESFSYLVEKHGYELLAREPRYSDPMIQKYALNPDYLHLYQLK